MWVIGADTAGPVQLVAVAVTNGLTESIRDGRQAFARPSPGSGSPCPRRGRAPRQGRHVPDRSAAAGGRHRGVLGAMGGAIRGRDPGGRRRGGRRHRCRCRARSHHRAPGSGGARRDVAGFGACPPTTIAARPSATGYPTTGGELPGARAVADRGPIRPRSPERVRSPRTARYAAPRSRLLVATAATAVRPRSCPGRTQPRTWGASSPPKGRGPRPSRTARAR